MSLARNVERSGFAMKPHRRSVVDFLPPLLILLAVAALYGPAIDAPLIFDDITFFGDNYASAYGANFQFLSSRFWSSFSLAFQRIIFGDNVAQFRAVNVALHLLTGGALYLFLHTFLASRLGDATHDGQRSRSRQLAIWLAVLLFLVHPIAVYGAAYLVQRSIVMATLFTLLMWWAHLRGLESGKPTWFLWSVLFCYLALFSKEHSVMAPVVAVLLTVNFPRSVWQRRLPIFAFLAYFTLAVTVTLQNKYAVATAYQPWLEQGLIKTNTDHLYLASVLTQAGLFFKYVFLWLVPVTAWMSIDISEPLQDIHALSSWFWGGLFAAYCCTGFWLVLRKGWPGLLGFALFAPAILFATEFSTIRVTEIFVLYRSYLWAPPLFILLPLLAERIDRRVWLTCGLLAGGLLFYLASERLHTLSSPIALWGDVIRLADARGDTTLRDRAYCNRGLAYLETKQLGPALADFEQARRWNPSQPLAYLGMGQVLARMGRLAEAKIGFDTALKLKPDWPQARLYRADFLRKQGETAAADADLRLACDAGLGLACYILQKATGAKDVYIDMVRTHKH